MTKTLMATASAMALLIGMPAAFAQTAPNTTTPSRVQNQPMTPPTGGTASSTQTSGQVDAQKLIGRNVINAQNETVGEIESLMVDQDGKIRSAILGVGGFLGLGERHVALTWDQLTVSPNSDRVTVNMTRDQVRALPEFRYNETQRRGSVFSDSTGSRTTTGAMTGTSGTSGTGNRTATGSMSGSSDTSGTGNRTATGSTSGSSDTSGTGNRTATGAMSGSSDTSGVVRTPGAAGTMTGNRALSASNLLGLNLHNSANETIGEVKDIIVGADGKVSEVIVGVGGFLGMGERYVAISWDQLTMSRSTDSAVKGQVGYTRDQLRDMPTWRQERTGWVRG